MDLTEGEEALAVAAIFHKGRLKRRLDAGYACEIDITFELLPVFRFVVKILNACSAQQHNPRFFALAGVDQQSFGHEWVSFQQGVGCRFLIERAGRAAAGVGARVQ